MNQLHAHSLIHGHVIHMGATMFRPLLSHIGVDKDKASGLCDQVWVVVTGDGRATDNDKAPLEDGQGHGEADGGPASRINLQVGRLAVSWAGRWQKLRGCIIRADGSGS